jgi:phage terminase large subunit-like protein
VVAGIDGGGLDDLLSLSVIGRHPTRRKWLHWQHSWAHELVLERRKSEASRLRDFAAAGDLSIVDDMTFAFGDLALRLRDLFDTGKLAQVGLDPAGVGLIVEAIAETGLSTEPPFLVGVSQGFQLQGAVKTAEVKVASGELVHCGQPIMVWAVGNAKTEQRGNALVITKQAAGSAKIDPLMAMFDAVALMSRNPQVARSYLENTDMMVL